MSVNAVQFGTTGTSDSDNFLEIYSGIFSESWRAMPKLWNTATPVLHRKVMTNQGVSYQNLQFGDLPEPTAEYTPGNDIAGQDYAVDETSVTRDKYVLAHNWVPRDAMKTAHYDILTRLGKAHSRKIGMAMDRRVFTTGALAARATAKTHSPTGLNIHTGGNQVFQVAADVATAFPTTAIGAANFRDRLRALGQLMDEDNVTEERWGWMTPYLRRVLSYDASGQVFSRDFITMGEGGNIMRREVTLVDGFKIVDFVNTTTNGGSLPDQNITTGPTKYQADFRPQASSVGTPVFLCLAQGPDGDAAVSVGTWEDVVNEVYYDPTNKSWLVSSIILAGLGQMTPPCAGAVVVSTS